MKCPYCSAEMEIGYIEKERGLITWTPEGKRVPRLFPFVEGKTICIGGSEKGPAFGDAVTAHLCRQCEKIVIDLKNA